MKKILSIALIIVMLSTLCVIVNAKAFYNDGDYNYVVEGDEAHITVYHGFDSVVKVPQQLGKYLVTGIDEYAFIDNNVTTVYLPPQVEHIDDNAFNDTCSVYKAEILIKGNAVATPDTYASSDILAKDLITTAPVTERETGELNPLPDGVTSAGYVETIAEANEDTVLKEEDMNPNAGTGPVYETNEKGETVVVSGDKENGNGKDINGVKDESTASSSLVNTLAIVLIVIAVVAVVATVVFVVLIKKKKTK